MPCFCSPEQKSQRQGPQVGGTYFDAKKILGPYKVAINELLVKTRPKKHMLQVAGCCHVMYFVRGSTFQTRGVNQFFSHGRRKPYTTDIVREAWSAFGLLVLTPDCKFESPNDN